MKLRCPNCGVRRVILQTTHGQFYGPAINRCPCPHDCRMCRCVRCGHEGHETEFAMAKCEPEDQGHPTQSEKNTFPTDQYLRQHGFVRESRPRQGQPIWRRFRDGQWKEYTQTEALLIVDEEITREVGKAGLI